MKHIQRRSSILLALALLGGLLIGAAATRAAPALQTALTPVAYLPIISGGRSGPTLGGCPVFPADNIWNARIDSLPADPHSSQYINSAGLGASTGMHPDFGSGVWPEGSNSPIGIPFVVVPAGQALVDIHYTDYGDESDPRPLPRPPKPPH
jgi:hypothetical protein